MPLPSASRTYYQKLSPDIFLSLVFLILLLARTISPTNAIAPPHPDLLEESRQHRLLHEALYPNVSYASQPLPEGLWEPALDYKRRLDPDNPASEICETCSFGTEACRFLSAFDCQDMEDKMLEQAEKTRLFVASRGGKRSYSTPVATNTVLSSRSTNLQPRQKQQQQPTPTQITTLVVLVVWKGHEERKAWMPQANINTLWNGNGVDPNIIPTGSIANYTKMQSHGKVTLKADIVDWQVTDKPEAYYANGRSGLPQSGSSGPDLVDAYSFILDRLDANGFNFNKYDSDNDSILDHVQFLHTGYAAELGGVDCYTNAKSSDRIWSHMLPVGRSDWVSKSGKKLGMLSTSSVFTGKCDKKTAPLGIMMHEFYHTLGLPDLYDRVGGLNPGLGGLGAYDMISSPYGAKGDQRYPGSLSPWSKLDIGFSQAVEITQNGTYTIRPSNFFPDYFIIKKGFEHEGEYLLIENRLNVGIDKDLWNNGVLIYKIDETLRITSNKGRGYPGMAGWPGNGQHYQVALMQADSEYDLEKGKNNGDPRDYYRFPGQKLGPGPAQKDSSGNGDYPNTDGYGYGDIQTSHITIDNFREAADKGTYTFRVSFGYQPPCQDFLLDIKTDDYPDEISWTLTQDSNNKVVLEGEGNGRSDVCLAEGECFTFVIKDKYGDGMCCEYGEGYYTGFLDGRPISGFNGGKTFKDSATHKFCVGSAGVAQAAPPPSKSPTPLPTKQPTPMPVPNPSGAATHPSVPSSVPQQPSNSPTTAPKPACKHNLDVLIRTDNRPQDTTWEITTESGIFVTGYKSPQAIAANPLAADTTYKWSVCFNWSGYNLSLKIYDSGSNGITPPGGFLIRLDGADLPFDGKVIGNGRTVQLRVGRRLGLGAPEDKTQQSF